MDKAKKALKEAIRDKMQGHILEAIGYSSLNSKDLKDKPKCYGDFDNRWDGDCMCCAWRGGCRENLVLEEDGEGGLRPKYLNPQGGRGCCNHSVTLSVTTIYG